MPEQTLPAYVAALRLGVDYVDMDIGMTRDGVLVITHDMALNPDLARDRNGRWITERIPIRSLMLQELRQYRRGQTETRDAIRSVLPPQRPVDHTDYPDTQGDCAIREK